MARMRGIHADVIRGSIGGNTFFANQFHQILIRQRTSPVDPSTTRQVQVRQAMGGASGLYENLTELQKEAWDDYADTLSYPNPLGPISVPGRQVAVGNLGLREYLETLGETFTSSLDTAPTYTGFLTLSNIVVAAPSSPGTGFSISIYNPNPEDVFIVFKNSATFNNSRFRFKGPFRSGSLQAVKITASSSTVTDFTQGSDDDIVFTHFRAISEEGAVRTSRPGIVRAVVDTTT